MGGSQRPSEPASRARPSASKVRRPASPATPGSARRPAGLVPGPVLPQRRLRAHLRAAAGWSGGVWCGARPCLYARAL